jgi:predicted nucleotidyltransferase component of viral defense system
MLDVAEEIAIAEQFGVARDQVRRDHLISHLLAALSDHCADQVIFFGGTALCRSFVPDGRLSEDIDLIAVGGRADVAVAVERLLVSANRREYPGLRWLPPLSTVRDTDPAVLSTEDGVNVRIQLLNQVGYPPWPVAPHALVQRYSDAPAATLTVPTRAAFAAWKTAAWTDRAASRDLYDLWSLAGIGAIDREAAALFTRYGPTNKPPTGRVFSAAPDEAAWVRDLGAQTRLTVTAAEALTTVRDAWTSATA